MDGLLEFNLVSILKLGPFICSPTINSSKEGSPKSIVKAIGWIISSDNLNLDFSLISLGKGSYSLIKTSVGSLILSIAKLIAVDFLLRPKFKRISLKYAWPLNISRFRYF